MLMYEFRSEVFIGVVLFHAIITFILNTSLTNDFFFILNYEAASNLELSL